MVCPIASSLSFISELLEVRIRIVVLIVLIVRIVKYLKGKHSKNGKPFKNSKNSTSSSNSNTSNDTSIHSTSNCMILALSTGSTFRRGIFITREGIGEGQRVAAWEGLGFRGLGFRV